MPPEPQPLADPDASAVPGPLARLRRGVRHSHNWFQLVRFCSVGASGYVVNLAIFGLCVGPLDSGHRIAAVAAFCVAVLNNFTWNRRWTFSTAGNALHQQAFRFMTTSVFAFLGAFLILELLVRSGMPELPAQAVSIVCATPLSFVGNKVWTFSAGA